MSEVSVYVLPTQPGRPPQACLFEAPDEVPEGGAVEVDAMLVTWSPDMGAWVNPASVPLPAEIGEVITEHAKSLGVPWD
jgi:hypothetical protein